MFVAGVLIVLLALFGGFALVVLRDLEYAFLDSVMSRVRARPAFAQRGRPTSCAP